MTSSLGGSQAQPLLRLSSKETPCCPHSPVGGPGTSSSPAEPPSYARALPRRPGPPSSLSQTERPDKRRHPGLCRVFSSPPWSALSPTPSSAGCPPRRRFADGAGPAPQQRRGAGTPATLFLQPVRAAMKPCFRRRGIKYRGHCARRRGHRQTAQRAIHGGGGDHRGAGRHAVYRRYRQGAAL